MKRPFSLTMIAIALVGITTRIPAWAEDPSAPARSGEDVGDRSRISR
jgi:hypothetical protein